MLTKSPSQFEVREHLESTHENLNTSEASSEHSSTQPTTPTSMAHQPSYEISPVPRQAGRVIPAVPMIFSRPQQGQPLFYHQDVKQDRNGVSPASDLRPAHQQEFCLESSQPPLEPRKSPPKSWADLVREKSQSATLPDHRVDSTPASLMSGSFSSQTVSLAEVLKHYSHSPTHRATELISFQPRGLVNTGNMCYMNSVSL